MWEAEIVNAVHDQMTEDDRVLLAVFPFLSAIWDGIVFMSL